MYKKIKDSMTEAEKREAASYNNKMFALNFINQFKNDRQSKPTLQPKKK